MGEKSAGGKASEAQSAANERTKVLVVLEARHLQALNVEAERLARLDPDVQSGRKALSPDRSSVLRAIIDRWIDGERRTRK